MRVFQFEVHHVHPDGGGVSDRRYYYVIHETAELADEELRKGFGRAWSFKVVKEGQVEAGMVLAGESIGRGAR